MFPQTKYKNYAVRKHNKIAKCLIQTVLDHYYYDINAFLKNINNTIFILMTYIILNN